MHGRPGAHLIEQAPRRFQAKSALECVFDDLGFTDAQPARFGFNSGFQRRI